MNLNSVHKWMAGVIVAILSGLGLWNAGMVGSAPNGVAAFFATSSVAAVTSTASSVFATSTCSARIITTTNLDGIRITFSDYAGQAPTATFGHWQPASTTEVYDSGLYGCGLVKVYSGASQTLTVSETR